MTGRGKQGIKKRERRWKRERERDETQSKITKRRGNTKNGMKEREIDLSGPLPPARAKSLREFSP